MRLLFISASRLVFGLATLGLAASAAHAQIQDLFVSVQYGGMVDRFAATGPSTFGTTPTSIPDADRSPKQGLVFDSQGDLFAANQNTISEHTAGTTPGTFGGIVTLGDYSLEGVTGLALDSHGNLFAANFDGDSLTEFASTGAGTFGAGRTIASISNPNGLAVDAFGDLFVTSDAGTMNTGSIVEYSPNSQGNFGAGKTIATGLATYVSGLAFDSQGNLFSATGSGITEFVAGSQPGTFGPATTVAGGFGELDGLAFDARGNLFAVTQYSNVMELASLGNGTFGPATTIETGLNGASYLTFGPSAPAAVPEASTTVSFGLLLTLGLGGMAFTAKRKKIGAKA